MLAENTFPALLKAAATTQPDRVFLHAQSAASGAMQALTFGDMQTRSRRVAAGLLARGIGPGDRVAVAAPNQLEWLELFFGVVRIGAIVVTLNVRYREHELDYMLNHSGARMVVTSATDGDFDFRTFYANFRDRIPAAEHVVFIGDDGTDAFSELPTGSDMTKLAAIESKIQDSDPAIILYTSGTTGRPKGATMTHASTIGAARAQVAHYGTKTDDKYLCVLPLNHVGGITCNVTSALLTCSTLVMQPAFSPASALAALDEYGITVFLGVPTMWNLMLANNALAQTDTASVRLGIVGGSNLEPTLANTIKQHFANARLANLYGLSETSGAAVGSLADESVESISRSIGVTYPGVESRVVDLDGNVVADGEDGELQLRGPGTAGGYWTMPEATAKAFLADGWVATGDMVSRDADGHIVLFGRRKEMFLQGGYNVYPVEVENVLTAHPAVSMAAGFGVPDDVLGEVGCYYIVLGADQQVTADKLRDYCKTQLADYKVPRQFVFADALPTTPAGKIAKADLRKQYEAD